MVVNLEVYQGKSVQNGIAFAKIHYFLRGKSDVIRKSVDDVEKEVSRYNDAKSKVVTQLKEQFDRVSAEIGKEDAAIFEAQAMILEGEEPSGYIKSTIRDLKVNAEYAVLLAEEKFAKIFLDMEDDYFSMKADDIKDLSERLILILLEQENLQTRFDEPVIIAADELLASDIVRFDSDMIAAFVSEKGNANSHAAILSKSFGIPMIYSLEHLRDFDGKSAIVNGYTGTLCIEPSEEAINELNSIIKQEESEKNTLLNIGRFETVTADGRKIKLYANITGAKEAKVALSCGAEGIGLLRSEYLFLRNSTLPTFNEQFEEYKSIAEAMEGREVIIRTLDLGDDKIASCIRFEKKEKLDTNIRGIRLCLEHPELFKVQLKAIFCAAAYGNVSVMYPMITSVDEVLKIKEIVEEVRVELKALGVKYSVPRQGAMIETLPAVRISDKLAGHVDFFSIGTNDLTRAVTMQTGNSTEAEGPCESQQKTILQLIKTTIDNAHDKGIEAMICGEIASDINATEQVIKMGIDGLSVSPSMLLKIKQKIRSIE